ncbi:hypothetical protein [Nocardia cyriacigeorgica]|uniref:Uncharacterized protein n=1 Tax=Nocardia cyriacigeorgica TaxID=135487 RepID=A0A5R8NB44_9NOCA|nr:hypothetical protein [Nocardia cyriacigeorgica]TLF72935.1 hypothetical protein FEK34_28350 [Nocardia cyriacigeorgica]
MTTPHLPTPPGDAFVIGDGQSFGSTLDQASIQAIATGGAKVKFGEVQGAVGSQLRTPISNAYTIAVSAQGAADVAVSDAQAAVNAASAAESTAASASERASYWEAEFVVASAEVLLGVNELLIGLCQNVPGGLTRTITDMHVALLEQPNGMSFELKKWSADGTTATVLDTYTIPANTTRINWPNLGFVMQSRERVYINVTSITGTVPPTVLQVLLFGVME